MICFIQESPMDYLLYYPIIKALESKKTEYIVYDADKKTSVDMIHFLAQHPNVNVVVNYGGSERKLAFALLCREYEQKFIHLHGEERDEADNGLSYLDTISRIAYQNFVSSESALAFLLSEGIRTSTGLFECPITNLTRKSEQGEAVDVLYISKDPVKIAFHVRQLKEHGISSVVYDYSNGLPSNWKGIYSHLRSAKWIVSDSFLFDKPTRNLGKHFFFVGEQVLEMTNLGISTHCISQKLELHDYLRQSWRTLEPINHRYGMQSLLKLL